MGRVGSGTSEFPRRWDRMRCLGFSLLGVAGFLAMTGAAWAQEGVNEEAINQIRAVLEEKASLSPELQKIDTRLLRAVKRRKGDPADERLPSLRSTLEPDADGRVLGFQVRCFGDVLSEHRSIIGCHKAWCQQKAHQ